MLRIKPPQARGAQKLKALNMNLNRITSRVLFVLLLMLPLCLPPVRSAAQSGALIPSSIKEQPDPTILSLQVMNVDVLIDNQHARVRVLQIFDNHVAQILEGKYLFALPPQASISDFAVWDADTRIPGVMLEKRRANAVYGELKQPKVDPGLLQQDDEHEGRSAFSAKVFPIPAYGTKRVELEYTEMLPVEGLTSHFTFPLKPSSGDPTRVGEFNLHVHILSDYAISSPAFAASSYAMQATKADPHEYEADFHAREIELKDDFSFDYRINIPESALSWIAYRAPEQISAYDLRDPALASPNPDGYFEARAIFNQQRLAPDRDDNNTRRNAHPRNVILLLDTSLSMYGEKLVRAVEAVDYFLHSLSEQDQFNLVLFNEEPAALSSSPLAATPEHVEQALDFIKGNALAGGTDLKKGLTKALELAQSLPTGERSVVLISDANPTLGTRNIKQLVQLFDKESKSVGVGPSTRFFAFALGTDANQTLLQELAQAGHGYFAQARETEDISTQLKIFFDQVGSQSIEGLRLTSDQGANLYQIYATHPNSFDGSSVAFVGRYKKPSPQARINVLGQYGNEPLTLSREVVLPEFDDTHEHLPRVWARARVDALLHEMDLSGEREDYIAEIIRLSEKYKFVTPYTAFLAAPRALLRPRLIQPGDPVLRVRTDASIKSVFAVLPFGETLPLKFLNAEGVWEVRFLAPSWMPDGTYRCRLLMTDREGHGYQEEKSFVVDSHAPKLKASVGAQTVRAGDELMIKVAADSDTARLVARMYGAQPAQLFWSSKEGTNTGRLRVPAGLAAGRYTLYISAEDFAHNQSSVEIQIEVLGRS
jgi:Ca-activated chloride channel family protein